jgi:hypothetical protein
VKPGPTVPVMACAGAADVGVVAASAAAAATPSSQARVGEIVVIAVPPQEVEMDDPMVAAGQW